MINWHSEQIIGSRQRQEDTIGFWSGTCTNNNNTICDYHLAIIADGMGGHNAGDIASKLVVDAYIKFFKNVENNNGINTKNIPELLLKALDKSNEIIAEAIKNKSDYNNMGTTIVAVFYHNNQLHWLSIGDSLLFLIDKHNIIKLNAEHTVGAELNEAFACGDISKLDLERNTDKHLITSAVMGCEIDLIDITFEATNIDKNSKILLASDGLNVLNYSEIQTIAMEKDKSLDEVSCNMIETVIQKDSLHQDNTSLIFISN